MPLESKLYGIMFHKHAIMFHYAIITLNIFGGKNVTIK